MTIESISSSGPSPSKADKKREQIIKLAAQLFDRDGYHQTSVDDIATAASLSKPTIYHYFKGKDEILFRIHEDFGRYTAVALEERVAEGLGPRECLFGVMADIIGVLDVAPEKLRVYFEYERELPDDFRKQIVAIRQGYHARVKSLVEQGMATGEFAPGDANLTTTALFSMANWTYRWYQPGGDRTAEEVARYFFGLLSSELGELPDSINVGVTNGNQPVT